MMGIIKGKKGSALVLSMIVVMLLMILCSTIMAFTLQNLKQSEQYKKMVFGYYSSDENLESALKKIQDDLKVIDLEAFNYTQTKKGFMLATPYDVTDMTPNMQTLINSTIASVPDSMNRLSTFYTNVTNKWNDIYSNYKDRDDFGTVSSDFLKGVYKRYYFLLINEIMSSDNYKTMLTGTSYLKSGSSSINVKMADGCDYNDMTSYEPKDADNTDSDHTNYDTSNDAVQHKYNTITINYVKNGDKTDTETHKAIEQNSIKTKMVLKVPNVDFTVKTQTTYNRAVNGGQVNTDPSDPNYNLNGNALMGNAIVSYGNFVVRDGSTANVYGDMYVKGNDVVSTDVDQYAKSADFTGIDQDVLDSNENKGGIRVGIPKETAASKLILRGTAYTPGYIHTIGENSAIDICDYDAFDTISRDDTKGKDFKGYGFRDRDATTNHIIPHCIDYSQTDGSPTAPADEFGGDVFCKKLITEEIANKSAIKVFGRAFVANNLQADAENPPDSPNGIDGVDPTRDDDNLTSSVEIGGDYYGLNSGNYTNTYDYELNETTLHSAIIQNGENATIKLDGKVYIPSVVYLLTHQLNPLDKNYKTVESMTAAQNDTLSAYSTGTDYTSSLGAGVAALDNTHYAPFSFYTFTGSNDEDSLKKSTKQFLSYFTDTHITLPKSNITWNKGGWILGTGLIKRSSGTGAEIVAEPSVDDVPQDTPANILLRQKYVKDDSRVTFLPNAQEGAELAAYTECIDNIRSAYANKTLYYYFNDLATEVNPTHPKLNVNAKISVSNNGGAAVEKDIDELNEEDALLVKDKDVTIKTDGVYVNGTKMKFNGSGIIITNKNVTIQGGIVKGLIATNHDIEVTGDSTVAYSDSKVKDVIGKYSQIAAALGATVTITKKRPSNAADALAVTSGYHVDSMSRFTRTEWTENE